MKFLFSFVAILLSFCILIKIRHGEKRAVKILYFILIYNLFIKYVIGSLGLPSLFNYLSDFLLLIVFVDYLLSRKRIFTVNRSLIICTIVFLAVSVVSYILNHYSIALFFWGLRNNVRFILFGMMCSVYFRKKDIYTIMDILFLYFLLNIIVVTYQGFFTTINERSKGDFISGLFSNGSERGGNASLNWLMCILCTYSITNYLNKTIGIMPVAICVCGSLYMAALSEIKLFYLELILIGIGAIFLCKKSLKVIVFISLSIVGIVLGIRLLYLIFPSFSNFFSIDKIMAYASRDQGYSNHGQGVGIDRLTVFSYTFSNFSLTGLSRLIGRGLGNADYSSFDFLTSSFYKEYAWTSYYFFHSAMLLIETGVLGLISYLGYIMNFLRISFASKTKNIYEKTISQSTVIMVGLCVISIFANQTLKLEASSYLVNCILIFPLLLRNQDLSSVNEKRFIVFHRISFSKKYRSVF